MKKLTLSRWIDLRAGVAPSGALPQGKPRRFAIEAYDGGPLPVDGFKYPVIVDLSTLEIPESFPLLIDHEATVEATLGTTDLITNTGQSLAIGGLVTATSAKALAVVEQADKGQRWQASVGVRIGEEQEIPSGQTVVVNKQVFRGPVIVARNSQLYETSVLPAGADWTTTVNLAASAASLLKGSAIMTFEQWLASIGIDQTKLDDKARAALTQTWDAMQSPKPMMDGQTAPPVAPVVAAPAAPPVAQPVTPAQVAAKAEADFLAATRKTSADEYRRIGQVELLTIHHPEIRATAIEKGWSPMETENAVLKAQIKTKSPSNLPSGGRSGGCTPVVLEAAVCLARRIPNVEKRFSDQDLQAAHDHFRGGIGLQQLLLHAACQNGYDASPGERIRTSNLRNVLKAAFSTVSLPGIFGNVANKELLAGYESDESLMLWKEIAEIKSVSDFKTVTSYRLLDNMEYEELGPGGKIKSGTLGEESYTRSARTVAKMFSLTRESIINDDLGALDDLRKRLGLGAAVQRSNMCWRKFMDNGSFFTSGRGNYISGATTNLGTDAVGLQLGLNAFRNMTSPSADGAKRIGGEPDRLMVPTELSAIAEQFYVNQNLGGGTTVANANIYAKKYKPLVVPWLSDSTFTGYSTTAWYLLRPRARYAPIVVSLLDGVEQPIVESAEADFDTLGVQFRGYSDGGCDLAEYVAGLKSKGAA